jgi:anaerobic magnesium-protoporphyrin IX monomethyl ester cyclase
MRVLFIDPIRLEAGKPRASRVSVPDIGLAYLSACLKRAGHEAAVIDSSVEKLSLEELFKRAVAFSPDVVGMPLFTYKVPGAMKIARRVKEIVPGVIIVVGGAHVTALPKRTMRDCAEFDFAVLGEGEETLLELVGAIDNNAAGLQEIKGLIQRDGDEIVRSANRGVIKNLDALPFPAWELFPIDKYHPMYSNRKFLELPVSSSRGCTGRCSFCFRLSRGFTRGRLPSNVIDELIYDIEKFGAESVMFVDEAFTSDKERAHRLCDLMVEAGIPGKLRWICQTRINMLDRDILRCMKEAGCTHISCGMESGSQEILDKNRKGINLESAREAIVWAKEAGLEVDTNYILGLPYETNKAMSETRTFSLTTRADYASYFIFVPYPGTTAMKLARDGKANLKLISEDWSKYEIQTGGVVELDGISRKKLERFQILCYLSFYLRPSKWGKLVKMIGLKTIPSTMLRLISGKW